MQELLFDRDQPAEQRLSHSLRRVSRPNFNPPSDFMSVYETYENIPSFDS
jgi:hypothetical protein